MSRIPTPATVGDAPEQSRPLLEAVNASLGSVPNLFRLTGTSPAALEGYLNLSGALGKGALDPATRERIALAIAEYNECGYCLGAHTYLGSNVAKLSSAEIESNRLGGSTDAKANAAVVLAVEVAEKRGGISDESFQNVKAAGYSDEEIVEIIAHVALNTLTNYLNIALQTEIDFPEAPALTI